MKPLTPRGLDWIDRAPVQVTRSRRIAAPRQRVWDAIADHVTWPEWFSPLTKVEVLDDGASVGAHRRVHIRSVALEEEFLAWDEGSRFAFCVVRASIPGLRSIVEDVRLEDAGPDATTITYTQAFETKGSKLMSPILRRALPKSLDKGLAGLAEHLER